MCDINGTTVSVTSGGSTMITVGTLDHRRRARFVVLLAAILAVTGCATTRREEAASTEQLLAAAGFQMRPADTPERVAALASMPREKLVVRSKDGNVVYTYADPEKCHCLYVGGPKEYAALQQIGVQREIAAHDPEAVMEWPGWGPWLW